MSQFFDPNLYAGINAAEQSLRDREAREERRRVAQQQENERAERVATEQHRRNQELIRPRVLPPWQDPLARKQESEKIAELIQRVQDGCGEVLLLTLSMVDQIAHKRTMLQLIDEVRAEAKQRHDDPTRLATNDRLCTTRYKEIYQEQEDIVKATAGTADRKAKERVRILAPAPMNGNPFRSGCRRIPHGWEPSQAVLDAQYPPEPVLRVTDYFPPRAPGFIPKVVVKKDGDGK